MENILSEFSAGTLDLKLTDEKIIIKSITSSETFALRSINGIGILDLVDKYNAELTIWNEEKEKEKDSKRYANILFVIGGILMFLSVLGGKGNSGGAVVGLVFLSVGLYFNKKKHSDVVKKPVLLSCVRIMMNGGNRDFKFDKTSSKSSDIADFIAKVESTLTAYHKNN